VRETIPVKSELLTRPLGATIVVAALLGFGCGRIAASSQKATKDESARSACTVDASPGLLDGLAERRQWSVSAVKINLAKPSVTGTLLSKEGRSVVVQAWAQNMNDYSVPMMRVDNGSLLYALTEQEWKEFQGRFASSQTK
jgi:hypothetical protein